MITLKPNAGSAIVSAQMRAQRVADTGAELAVRRALYNAGFRYRKHYPVPRRPRRSIDIALPGKRIAIFIDGCFWHGCKIHGTVPKSNRAWWQAKLEENRQRDSDTKEVLVEQGWTVLRFWEHDNPNDVVAAVASVFGEPKRGRG